MNLSAFLTVFFLSAFIAGAPSAFAKEIAAAKPYSGDRSLIYKQGALEKEGRQLEKINQYDLAVQKYVESMKLEKEFHGDERGRPLAFIIRILQKKGQYQEALEKLKYLRAAHPEHELYLFWEKELDALVDFSKSNNPDLIYRHVEFIKTTKEQQLPPYALWTETPIVAILRLYDIIGDYDAGIAYIDEIMAYFKKATEDRGDVFKIGGFHNEYLKVREAFEREKQNGGPSCGKWGKIESPAPRQTDDGQAAGPDSAAQPADKYCIGDATQALIQSDYFPW